MAKILLHGEMHDIELTINDEGGVDAKCLGMPWNDVFQVKHLSCPQFWHATYDDMRDAIEYAEDHADEGR